MVARLRGIALQGTVLAKATAGTIRLRLFKIAAMVVVSVRRVHVRLNPSSQSPFHRPGEPEVPPYGTAMPR